MTKFSHNAIALLVSIACCAGCAKHEMVQQDQMIPAAPSAAATQVEPLKQAAPRAVVPEAKDAALTAASTKEAQVTAQAAKGTAEAAGGAASLQANLDKVFFDFDSHTLNQTARETLAKNARYLKQRPTIRIRIEGNCDELGSDEYNLSLGESRALSAQKYLETMGIDAARISVISYGKEKPADPGHDDAARAKNRRDEFVVVR